MFRLVQCTILFLAGMMIAVTQHPAHAVERWGCYEVTLTQQNQYDNPFTDVKLKCTFECGGQSLTTDGFYDGEGTWRVRVMPTEVGRWIYRTESNDPGLDGKTGAFDCEPPGVENHGPVRVANTFHFAYADGTPYLQIGTTCYAWIHQGEALEEQTLATLQTAPFNKLRMCVFPKNYVYNSNEPEYYAFAGTPPNNWDFTRPNPAFFQHLEARVEDLQRLGIEADIILFHPYDRWGFSSMPREADDSYLRYIVARLSSYRNVWWSMANEFDFMGSKQMEDWDRLFEIVRTSDPYDHLRSIHNGAVWYDHTKPWVTHASIQAWSWDNTTELRMKYGKPLIYDENGYEGDVPEGWGHLTAEQLVDHFWQGTTNGAYVGHSEAYKDDHDLIWWSKGGVLHGQSPLRIAFLRQVMESIPFAKMTPDPSFSIGNMTIAESGEAYLVYFRDDSPTSLQLPGDRPYQVDAIDPWEMTITSLNDTGPGIFEYTPPRPQTALRLTVYRAGEPRRPQAVATTKPTDGVAPLNVQFSGPEGLRCEWDFGDGECATGQRVDHDYTNPGLYIATLTVTNEAGASSAAQIRVGVESATTKPLVRVACAQAETHTVSLNGNIVREAKGALRFAEAQPWSWAVVGDGPLADLEGLRSFTVMGWVRPVSRETGSGGNRIAYNLNFTRAGFDLVTLADGRLRLAVNEWADHANNDSLKALPLNAWTFFAVTYDATSAKECAHWYLGDLNKPAELDAVTDYNRGATGRGSGPLTLGNYGPSLHQFGLDRQFRGAIADVTIFGSHASSRGVLSLDAIRKWQTATQP